MPNAGMAALGACVPIHHTDIVELADFVESVKIDLTVVGPELPLTLGIADEFQRRGLKIFGPNRDAAELEGSKVFSKRFMETHGIPTARFQIATSRGGHKWRLCDLTDIFTDWMAGQEYRESYFEDPSDLSSAMPEFLEFTANHVRADLRQADPDTVVIVPIDPDRLYEVGDRAYGPFGVAIDHKDSLAFIACVDANQLRDRLLKLRLFDDQNDLVCFAHKRTGDGRERLD